MATFRKSEVGLTSTSASRYVPQNEDHYDLGIAGHFLHILSIQVLQAVRLPTYDVLIVLE